MRIRPAPARWQFVTAVAGAMVIAGCHRAEGPAEDSPLPSASVVVSRVSEGSAEGLEWVPGTVRARAQAVIAAQARGPITSIDVAVGQRVEGGHVLMIIDAPDLAARLEQARHAMEHAEREWRRHQGLLDKQAVTQLEFAAVESRYRIASAVRAEAEAIVGHTRVRAPFAGVVVAKRVELGDLAAPGAPLLVLHSVDGMQFEFNLPKRVRDEIATGQELTVNLDSPARVVTGVVSEISPKVDPRSRSVMVKLDVDESAVLRAGEFGRVAIPTPLLPGESGNPRVPSSTVLERGQLEMVFVAMDGMAHMRLVKTGQRLGDHIEILGGLEPGESVVIDGHDSLRDGQPLLTVESTVETEAPRGNP